MIGQTISHYKILEKLGEGGMGIVYKAHDITLDRDVALKFLPGEFSSSEDEKSRFLHEAKAASALDHPNICTIYEAGLSPDGRMFIAMGYYEGTVLSRKIEKDRLAVVDAVWIAIQIAEGLQAAHGKGIVHRDIKSSNIIVSDQGQVRILDFGLARRKGLSKLTKTGTTVGTASYMSPEQAQGEKVDYRTDLWSLGVVLYEMVTGKLPFRGEHEAAILYSVVNEEPQSIQANVPDASPELIHIIRRALEKDVEERYQSAADMLIDLRRLKKETSKTGYRPVGDGSRRLTRRRKKISILLGAGILISLAVVSFFLFSTRSTNINPDWKQRQLQVPLPGIFNPAISGDGNWIAFSGRDRNNAWGLYLMNIRAGAPRLVTPLPFASWVDVSSNGGMILYTIYNLQTYKWDWYTIYSSGGDTKRIIEGAGTGPRFRPDGQRVGYLIGESSDNPSQSGKQEFWSVGLEGIDPIREFVDTISQSQQFAGWCWSPDGRKVGWLRSFEGYAEIVTHDLETGKETQVTFDKNSIGNLVWVRENQIVYTATDKNGVSNLFTVSATGGDPTLITKLAEPVAWVTSSLDGQTIIYGIQKPLNDFWIVNVSENRPRQITFNDEAHFLPAFSPDGKMIAFAVYDQEQDMSHIFVMDRDGTNRRQLSFGDESIDRFRWSPDGRRIAYGARKVSEPDDSLRTYILEVSNPGSPKYISRGTPNTWLDSVRLPVVIKGRQYLTSIDGAPPTPVFDDSSNAVFVYGGKYIIYRDLRQGKDTTAWWIVDGTKTWDLGREKARLLPLHAGIGFKMEGDGKILYYLRRPGELWKLGLPDGKEERIRANFLGVQYLGQVNPSWDGKEFIITIPRFLNNIVMIENLFK